MHHAPPLYDEESESQSRPHKRQTIEDLRELIRKEVEEAGLKSKHAGSSHLRMSLSPLSQEILNVQFSRKFSTLSFEYYCGSSDPMQHLRHYQDKMDVYSYDDGLLCRMFPSSLKGLASDWFYSLKTGTLHTF